MKQQRITGGEPAGADGDLVRQVLNIMEQGILVWDAEGRCLLFNNRVYRILEIGTDDLNYGTARADFRARAVERGDVAPVVMERSEGLIRAGQPYVFDRNLPSFARCAHAPKHRHVRIFGN